MDIDNSPFNATDVNYGPYLLPSHNVTIAWGVYNRAPRQEIYVRNLARMVKLRQEVEQGQRLVTDYFYCRVQNGIRTFENRQGQQRLWERQ